MGMNKKRQLLSGLCLSLSAVLLVTASGCGQAPAAEASSAVEEQIPVSVEVMAAGTGTIQNAFVYSGKVRPKEEANVIAMAAGKVATVYFEVGDRVKAGDVLFQIDTTDLLNNRKALEAQLEATNAQLRSAQTSVELVNGASMEAQILQAKSGLAQAELAYNDMLTTYENSKKLFEAGVIAKSDMDKVETGMANTKLAYEMAQKSYDLMANQMPAENMKRAQDGVAAAQAAQKAVKAQLESLDKSIGDTAVTTPIDGFVTSKTVTPEGIYSSAAGPAFVVSNLDEVYVDVGISEQAINMVHAGDSVDVYVKTVSDKPLTGKVETVSPGASNQTGTYSVRILLPNGDGALKSGMFGEVHFSKEKKENTLILPRDAVLSSDGKSYVFLTDNGVAKQIQVETGIDTGDQVEILSGVSAGDSVIIKGQNFLNEGDKIEPVDSSDVKEEG